MNRNFFKPCFTNLIYWIIKPEIFYLSTYFYHVFKLERSCGDLNMLESSVLEGLLDRMGVMERMLSIADHLASLKTFSQGRTISPSGKSIE